MFVSVAALVPGVLLLLRLLVLVIALVLLRDCRILFVGKELLLLVLVLLVLVLTTLALLLVDVVVVVSVALALVAVVVLPLPVVVVSGTFELDISRWTIQLRVSRLKSVFGTHFFVFLFVLVFSATMVFVEREGTVSVTLQPTDWLTSSPSLTSTFSRVFFRSGFA